jgi:hypothetical protein
MVASKDDRLVGLTAARAGGTTPRGDSTTFAEGNCSAENVSAKL